MRLLVLAPQPFFQERGTPIAVRLVLEVLAQRLRERGVKDQIDVLSYHEGQDIKIPGVQVSRIGVPRILRSFLCNIRPGVSLKKLVCDVLFVWSAVLMCWRARKQQYNLIHAVEESVFVAMLLRWIFGIPYIYDMDSSLALQLTDKWFLLKPLTPILEFLERMAVKYSLAVAPVCDALLVLAKRYGARHSQLLQDVSLLPKNNGASPIDLRAQIGAGPNSLIISYIGNLESYQGIDLLIESLHELSRRNSNWSAVIIGGAQAYVELYRAQVQQRGLSNQIFLIGPRPLTDLGTYIAQSDILVSPRIKGNNTPMKIYSYLHSGKVIVATDLPTHTQVLDSEIAFLCEPNCMAFSQALYEVIVDGDLRERLGRAAQAIAEKNYTFEIFQFHLNQLYDQVSSDLSSEISPPKDKCAAVGN